MHRTIRPAAVALLLLTLGTTPIHARARASSYPSPAGVLSVFWQWISPFLSTWTKEGSDMDPNGRRPPSFTTPSGSNNAGGMMGPNGLAKEGGAMDPNGRTHGFLYIRPSTEAGGDTAPNG